MIGDTELLELWEHSLGLEPARRALALAAAADPVSSPSELGEQPVGVREARLLELRAELCGPDLEATATCPACGEQVEFEVDSRALGAVGPALGEADDVPRTIEVDGIRITWRCVTGGDLASLAELADGAGLEDELLRRCILAVEPSRVPDGGPEGRPVDVETLDDAARAAVVEAMEGADPLAEVLVALTCPACGTGFSAEVDVAEFAWTELDAVAAQLLWEVDSLARAYGWTEADVLALSPRRRRTYLDMVVGTDD